MTTDGLVAVSAFICVHRRLPLAVQPAGAVLAQFGKDLGLSVGDAAEAERLARDFVIDTAFDEAWANLEVEPGERRHILSLARKLGVTADDVARIETAYRKRTGRDEQ